MRRASPPLISHLPAGCGAERGARRDPSGGDVSGKHHDNLVASTASKNHGSCAAASRCRHYAGGHRDGVGNFPTGHARRAASAGTAPRLTGLANVRACAGPTVGEGKGYGEHSGDRGRVHARSWSDARSLGPAGTVSKRSIEQVPSLWVAWRDDIERPGPQDADEDGSEGEGGSEGEDGEERQAFLRAPSAEATQLPPLRFSAQSRAAPISPLPPSGSACGDPQPLRRARRTGRREGAAGAPPG